MRRRPGLVATVAYWTKDKELLRVGGYTTFSMAVVASVRCLYGMPRQLGSVVAADRHLTRYE